MSAPEETPKATPKAPRKPRTAAEPVTDAELGVLVDAGQGISFYIRG